MDCGASIELQRASQLLVHFVVAASHVSGLRPCAIFSLRCVHEQYMPIGGFHRAVTSIPDQEYSVSEEVRLH